MSAWVAWTEKLPDRWKAVPLRAAADFTVSNVDKIPADDELPVRLCNYTDVYNNEFITSEMEFMRGTATPSEIKKFGLQLGDVAITKDSESWDDIAIPALVVQTADDLVCGYHLALLRPRAEKLDGRFLFRCLQAKTIRVHLELAANGVTRFGIPKDEIGKLPLPLPALPEQRAIADFLDRETARLDALVAEKERWLELLAEKRRALITRAVTRGLNPDASLRDSGLPWLGEMPAKWTLMRVKFATTKIGSGKTPKGGAEVYASEGIPLIRSQNVLFEGVSLKDVVFIDEETDGEMAGSRVLPGDVLLNITGASIGRCCAVPENFGRGNVNQHVCILRPDKSRISTQFLSAFLGSEIGQVQIFAGEEGISREGLSFEDAGNFALALPKLDEQRAIVAYISAETAKLDGLRAATERTIGLLKERRAALIAAAVTGKVEVGLAKR